MDEVDEMDEIDKMDEMDEIGNKWKETAKGASQSHV